MEGNLTSEKVLDVLFAFGLYRQELEVERILFHEGYNNITLHNDISLIMLKKPLDSSYMPVCLGPKLKDYTGEEATVIGWGGIRDNTIVPPCMGDFNSYLRSKILWKFVPTFFDTSLRWNSPVLRKTTQTIISNRECKKSTGLIYHCDKETNTTVPKRTSYRGKIFGDMICGASPGRGTCLGDSGGPFTVEENGKHILVGVSSFASGCAKVDIY